MRITLPTSRTRVLTVLSGLGVVLGLHSPHVLAAGLTLEQGARGLGTDYAGASATASDPTTLYYNPAGMSMLTGDQVSVSVTHLQLAGKYTDSGSSKDSFGNKLTGNNGGDFGQGATIPNLYYVHNFGDMAAGIGVSAPFGLSLSYDKSWKGRFSDTYASLSVVEIAPAFSYKIANGLSVGGSIGYQMLKTTLGAQINEYAACLGGAAAQGATSAQGQVACFKEMGQEGDVALDGTSAAVGFGLGVLYQPTTNTNVGLNFRSATHHKVKGTAKFENTSFFSSSKVFTNGDFTSPLTLPAQISLAATQNYGAIGVMADITRTNWSSFQKLEYDYKDSTPSTIVQLNWRDTTRFGLGGTYNVTPEIPLRLGVALDQSPVPDSEHRVTALPDSNRTDVAVGAGYETGKYRVDLGFSDAMLSSGDSNTTSATGDHLVGTFSGGSIMTVALQFDYIM